MKATRQEIQNYVLRLLEELCRDWDYSRPVGPDSLLFSELGLESLDAVVLATSIQEHFGQQMPFAELLAAIGEQQRDLSIAELVDFIDKHLGSRHTEATPAGRA